MQLNVLTRAEVSSDKHRRTPQPRAIPRHEDTLGCSHEALRIDGRMLMSSSTELPYLTFSGRKEKTLTPLVITTFSVFEVCGEDSDQGSRNSRMILRFRCSLKVHVGTQISMAHFQI